MLADVTAAGLLLTGGVRAAVDAADLLLLDIKAIDEKMALRLTGRSNQDALMLLGAPFVFIIAPRQGVVTAGLAVAFLFAVLFDVVNVRNLLRALRVARRATS